ncbi:MAG TPA: DnaJ domain-containing protein [Bryobacteraceae bacterium]|nr:DnaJ domain-containing protein [Bryobacteraceae bacterium]
MRSDSERRRHPRSDATKNQAKLLVEGCEVTLVDFSSSGLRIEGTNQWDAGARVRISGEIQGSAGRIPIGGPCQVRWCSEVGGGLFHAGLFFEHASDIPHAPAEMLGNGVDYYEALQVGRRADADTIRRVFHLMAQRYHPDNRETGNEELFRQIVKAHEVLSDPARRAAFDIQLASHDQARLHLFENWQGTQGVQAEVIKRQAILRLLYNQRFIDAERPWIVLRDFENLMGCPREHLEFSFWVLREGKLVARGDSSRYEITYQGVAAVEAEETGGQPPAIFPLLPAPPHPMN